MPTKIPWCDETINPIIGCSPISEGCLHCIAKPWTERGMCEQHKAARGWDGKIVWADGQLEKIARFRKPRRIFIGLMTDLFHENVKTHWQHAIMKAVIENPQHTFMFLTKRPLRMRSYFQALQLSIGVMPPPNLWLGITAENQARADERIPILLDIPGGERFVSCEPLLGPIEACSLYELDWVIAGPETGPGARECQDNWINDMFWDCANMAIPFFDKRKDPISREFPLTRKAA